MEVQPPDFEIAACAIFCRAFSENSPTIRLEFLYLHQKLDEYVATAQNQDPVPKDRFHWRNNVFSSPTSTSSTTHTPVNAVVVKEREFL